MRGINPPQRPPSARSAAAALGIMPPQKMAPSAHDARSAQLRSAGGARGLKGPAPVAQDVVDSLARSTNHPLIVKPQKNMPSSRVFPPTPPALIKPIAPQVYPNRANPLSGYQRDLDFEDESDALSQRHDRKVADDIASALTDFIQTKGYTLGTE